MYSRHASVWIVKPGGTGKPALVISARPAPLPPRTSFILPSPSALPPPNEYTYLVPLVLVCFVSTSGSVVVAIIRPLLFWGFFGAFSHNLGKISDGGKTFEEFLKYCQSICTNINIVCHYHHIIEKSV